MRDFREKFIEYEKIRKEIGNHTTSLIHHYLENNECVDYPRDIFAEFYKVTLLDDSFYYFNSKSEAFTFGFLIFHFRRYICTDVAKVERVSNAEIQFEVVRENKAGILEDLTNEFWEMV